MRAKAAKPKHVSADPKNGRLKRNAQIERDGRWMAGHSLELDAKYRDKWIAVWKRRVIGVGDTAVEAARQADAIAPSDEVILSHLNYYKFDV